MALEVNRGEGGRETRWGGAHLMGPLHHGLHKGCGLTGTGTHSLSPPLSEHSRH